MSKSVSEYEKMMKTSQISQIAYKKYLVFLREKLFEYNFDKSQHIDVYYRLMGYAFINKVVVAKDLDLKIKSESYFIFVVDGEPKILEEKEEMKRKYNYCKFDYNSRRSALTYHKRKDVYF